MSMITCPFVIFKNFICYEQCFGSIFIESGSGYGSKLFLATPGTTGTYLIFFYYLIIRFSYQKKSIERQNFVKVT